ncbi:MULTISPECIES: XrtA/PEP-CTERM system exopolysaccharide export protein [Pseudoxanthomonas]|uniref:Sugar ABC transporter substrate-binding protein n=1 Tax=Pseudoxanthomonas japonensis TaxID=69284 RepID=A0ABQ6ZKC9_9GAMM|nr:MULTISPECIES: XrtA/PEP-CTERM system exopolysaccharide export protein [Pseudoxanthomonas]KAF1726607.1 sugar ABC transporter substrate-binding protein [Pseudoxanthomonas japonensis]NCT69982.1 sugar ABC transporter substrate-binding protein [Xanthomonadaceae bacterium]PZQ32296.1 MAG: sugar ABC transporter substrate-binding protein [Stenotrophomonas acidaminiphila]
MNRTFVGLTAVTLALLLAGCASGGGSSKSAPPQQASVAVENYQIGVDDIVQVSVWRNPELGITVPVRPDGMISVPLVGDVMAGGRTPTEVAADIQKKLADFVRDPQVAVILTELRSHEYLSRVRVTGAVRQPISIPYRQGMTVLDAVLAAGGVNEFAAPDRSDLFRRNKDETSATYPVRLDRILNRGDLSTNYTVAPGDVIVIPERTF